MNRRKTATNSAPTNAPLLNTINGTCGRLKVGRNKVYELIAAGKLRTVHFGRAVRVTTESEEALVREEAATA